jgi:hypothetical protein
VARALLVGGAHLTTALACSCADCLAAVDGRPALQAPQVVLQQAPPASSGWLSPGLGMSNCSSRALMGATCYLCARFLCSPCSWRTHSTLCNTCSQKMACLRQQPT